MKATNHIKTSHNSEFNDSCSEINLSVRHPYGDISALNMRLHRRIKWLHIELTGQTESSLAIDDPGKDTTSLVLEKQQAEALLYFLQQYLED